MPDLKPGSRLKSVACDTEVIVIRSVAAAADVRCGGLPMAAPGTASTGGQAPLEGLAGGTAVGKRYCDAGEQLELLCTKGGKGSLSLGETPLVEKRPKALPSSD